MRAQLAIGLAVLGGLFVGAGRPAAAQGLLWKLPGPDEENIAVVYEGTYVQKDVQPPSVGETEPIQWRRVIYLKALRRQDAMFEGEMVPCRWIEVRVRTGRKDVDKRDLIDAGPGGERIYKVLVPEHKVVGNTRDADGILVSMVPIIKGYRKLGDGPAEPIEAHVLQVYPALSLLRHYRDLEQEPGDFDLVVDDRPVKAAKYTGTHTAESRETRSTNAAEIWRSDDLPFGLAKWTVKLTREAKETGEPRSAFEQVSEITVEMTATRILRDVQSEIAEE